MLLKEKYFLINKAKSSEKKNVNQQSLFVKLKWIERFRYTHIFRMQLSDKIQQQVEVKQKALKSRKRNNLVTVSETQF